MFYINPLMTYFFAEDTKYQENGSTYITVYGYNGPVSQPTSKPVCLSVCLSICP